MIEGFHDDQSCAAESTNTTFEAHVADSDVVGDHMVLADSAADGEHDPLAVGETSNPRAKPEPAGCLMRHGADRGHDVEVVEETNQGVVVEARKTVPVNVLMKHRWL